MANFVTNKSCKHGTLPPYTCRDTWRMKIVLRSTVPHFHSPGVSACIRRKRAVFTLSCKAEHDLLVTKFAIKSHTVAKKYGEFSLVELRDDGSVMLKYLEEKRG